MNTRLPVLTAFPSFRRVLRSLMVPTLLLALSGCATIEALKLSSEAGALAKKGDYDAAITTYNSSLAKSQTPDAHAGLAEVYLKQGRFAEAEAECNAAIKLSPPLEGTQPQALPQLVRYYLIRGKAQLLQNNGPAAFESANTVRAGIEPWVANNPLNKGILKEAMLLQARIIQATDDQVTRALQIVDDPGVQLRFPDDNDFRAEKAIVLVLTKKSAEAQALYDQVLKSNPQEGDALLAKGLALALSGDIAGAQQLLGPVLVEDRSRAMVALRAARALTAEKKDKEAVALLKMLSDVQPNNYGVHLELATSYYNLGQWDESIASYQKVLTTYAALAPYAKAESPEALSEALKATPPTDIDKNNLEVFYQNLALSYANKKDYDNAIKSLERVAAINPSDATFRDISIFYRDKGDMAGAIRTLERVAAMRPDDAKVMKNLGQMTLQSDPVKSRTYFAKARALAPNDSDVLLGLGVGLYNAKMYKEAAVEFEEAVKLLPGNADALFYLGVSQLKSGNVAAADATLKKVVELKPDYADAYRELGNIARDRKDYVTMEKYFKLEDKHKKK